MSHIPAQAMPHAKPHDDHDDHAQSEDRNGHVAGAAPSTEPAPIAAEAKPDTIAVRDLPPREPSTPWGTIAGGVLAATAAVGAALLLRRGKKKPAPKNRKSSKKRVSRAARPAAD